jgi:hypothetical protein
VAGPHVLNEFILPWKPPSWNAMRTARYLTVVAHWRYVVSLLMTIEVLRPSEGAFRLTAGPDTNVSLAIEGEIRSSTLVSGATSLMVTFYPFG